MDNNKAYLLLGSNVGEREKFLSGALGLIDGRIGKTTARSALYSTQAWGKEDQDDFLNQVVLTETPLSADALLNELLLIEKKMGRVREQKWDARTIDIDILFFNAEIISFPHLIIPHPHLQERRFALTPLNEIAGSYIHPVLKKTVKTLLEECPDKLDVRLLP